MATQLTRKHKALTIVPLALLSAAWTVSLAGTSSATAETAKHPGTLPDGTTIPSQAITSPANIPVAGEIAPGIPNATAGNAIVNSASTTGIPSPALSAYMRAAQAINGAKPSCHMPWELVAAIGRVESDHGRYGGNVLTPKGVSQPGIYGPELNGRNGTQLIRDTDQGRLDHDTVYDRAVGPMQFIPSTWKIVGVDANGDGDKNPQDINDAALAAAVYLCSGTDNLSTNSGASNAVMRYNHSQQYVDLVLSIMRAYESGNYASVPGLASGGAVFAPSSTVAMNQARTHAKRTQAARAHAAHAHGSSAGGSTGTTTAPVTGGSGGTTPIPGTGSGSTGGGGGLPGLPQVTVPALPKVTVVPSAVPSPVTQTLTQAEAATRCLAQLGVSSVTSLNPTQATLYKNCMSNLGF